MTWLNLTILICFVVIWLRPTWAYHPSKCVSWICLYEVEILLLRFTRPEVLQKAASLCIVRDHSLYYKVRWARLYCPDVSLSPCLSMQEPGDHHVQGDEVLALPPGPAYLHSQALKLWVVSSSPPVWNIMLNRWLWCLPAKTDREVQLWQVRAERPPVLHRHQGAGQPCQDLAGGGEWVQGGVGG